MDKYFILLHKSKTNTCLIYCIHCWWHLKLNMYERRGDVYQKRWHWLPFIFLLFCLTPKQTLTKRQKIYIQAQILVHIELTHLRTHTQTHTQSSTMLRMCNIPLASQRGKTNTGGKTMEHGLEERRMSSSLFSLSSDLLSISQSTFSLWQRGANSATFPPFPVDNRWTKCFPALFTEVIYVTTKKKKTSTAHSMIQTTTWLLASSLPL